MKLDDSILRGLFKDEDWYNLLLPYLRTEEFARIVNTIRIEKEKGVKVLPKASQIFRAFDECPLQDLRIVSLGQDPYPVPGDACGIAFMVERNHNIPKSLRFIRAAIETDVYNGLRLNRHDTGDMLYLCKQGVLLLNSALTVQAGISDSHADLWRGFISYTIEAISAVKKDLIWMLWGKRAQSFENKINPLVHHILKASHPASAAYNNSIWETDNFSKANLIIKLNKLGEPIKW